MKKKDKAEERADDSSGGYRTQVPYIEISGTGELLLDGCRGFIEYGETQIRVRTPGPAVAVSGRGLYMKSMTGGLLIIGGAIRSVEWIF